MGINWKYISGMYEYVENKVSNMGDNVKNQMSDNISLNFLPGIKNFILGLITGGGNASSSSNQQSNDKELNKSGSIGSLMQRRSRKCCNKWVRLRDGEHSLYFKHSNREHRLCTI